MNLSEPVGHFLQNIEKYAAPLGAIATLAGVLASAGAKTFASWLSRRHGASIKLAEAPQIVTKGMNSSELEAAIARALGEKEAETSLAKGKIRDSAWPSLVARGRVVVRIREAAMSRAEQISTQKWSKIAANLLTIAQYIVGGVLASAFVQESLPPKWVGALGVLVLIASLFKQQYHPEINAEDARKKASRLQALVRSSEDQLATLDAKIATGQDLIMTERDYSYLMILLLT